MKKFRFSLQSVLALRRHQKQQAEILLAQKLQTQQQIVVKQQALEAETIRINQTQMPIELRAGRDLFLQSLQIKIHQLGSQKHQADLEVAEAQQSLIEAQAALRAVEKLRERQLSEWQNEYNRQQDKELAEVAARKHYEHQ